jgi:hypothetical protein
MRGWINGVGTVKTSVRSPEPDVASSAHLLRKQAKNTADPLKALTAIGPMLHGFAAVNADGNPDRSQGVRRFAQRQHAKEARRTRSSPCRERPKPPEPVRTLWLG